MYALSQAFRSLRHHLTSTAATFFTALVSFTLLFLLGMLLWNLDRVVTGLEQELEIAAFLSPEAKPEDIQLQLQSWPEISNVEIQTKDDALAVLQQDYPYLDKAKEFVANPLPNTVRVTLSDTNTLRETARKLEQLEGISSVEYGGKITEQLQTVLAGLRVAINILIILLLLDTFFSVMGTIRLSIENRRDELKVMQLVGATKRFIQSPFIAEGTILTVFAAAVSVALGIVSYRFLSTALQSVLPYVPVLNTNDMLRATVALLFLAFLMGSFGAYVASRATLEERLS